MAEVGRVKRLSSSLSLGDVTDSSTTQKMMQMRLSREKEKEEFKSKVEQKVQKHRQIFEELSKSEALSKLKLSDQQKKMVEKEMRRQVKRVEKRLSILQQNGQKNPRLVHQMSISFNTSSESKSQPNRPTSSKSLTAIRPSSLSDLGKVKEDPVAENTGNSLSKQDTQKLKRSLLQRILAFLRLDSESRAKRKQKGTRNSEPVITEKISGEQLLRKSYHQIPALQELAKFAKDIQMAGEGRRLLYGKPLSRLNTIHVPSLRKRDELLEIPEILHHFIKFFRQEKVLKTKGLFRLSGAKAEVDQIVTSLEIGQETSLVLSKFHIHSAADLFKIFLRQLPEPLFPFNKFWDLVNAFREDKYDSIDLIWKVEFPRVRRNMLQYICEFLAEVASFQNENMMNTQNLAIVFAPNMMKPKEEDIQTIMSTTGDCIGVVNRIFDQFYLDYLGSDSKALERTRVDSSLPVHSMTLEEEEEEDVDGIDYDELLERNRQEAIPVSKQNKARVRSFSVGN